MEESGCIASEAEEDSEYDYGEENPYCIQDSYPQVKESDDSVESVREDEGECLYIKLFHPVLILMVDTCENCQDVATLHCDQCSHSYCNMCATVRHRHSARVSHKLRPVNHKASRNTEITG